MIFSSKPAIYVPFPLHMTTKALFGLCVHLYKTGHRLNNLETEYFHLCEAILSLSYLRSISLRPQLTKAFDYNISQEGLKRA